MTPTWRHVQVLALVLAGCGAGPDRVQSPALVKDRFVQAVRADDPEAAYELLDRDLKKAVTREDFSTLWRENREEVLEIADNLRRISARPQAHARVQLSTQETVILVLEDGRWRLQGGVLDAVALRTPLDTVAALRQALQRRDLRTLLRVLSRRHRVAWEAAFQDTMERIRDPLDLEVDIRGDEAEVRTTGGGIIRMRREAGKWQVTEITEVE